MWSVKLNRIPLGWIASIVVLATNPASAQNQSITANARVPSITTDSFATATAAEIKQGSLPASFVIGGGCTQAWSVHMHSYDETQSKSLRFPDIGTIKCSTGSNGFSVYAATTTLKEDIRAGDTKRAGAYSIHSARAVKARTSVPTLLFFAAGGEAVLSIEPDRQDATVPQPWLSIFDQRIKPGDRALIYTAWREARKTVATLIAVQGLPKLP